MTREDYYIRASDSLTYNYTIVFTSTSTVNDGVASSVDGDSDHQRSQASNVKFSHNQCAFLAVNV